MYTDSKNDLFEVAAQAIRSLPDTLPVPTIIPVTELSVRRDTVLMVPYIIPTRKGRSLTTKIVIGIKLMVNIDGQAEEIDATACNGSQEGVYDLVLEKLSWRNDNAAQIADSLSHGYADFITLHLDAANDAITAHSNANKGCAI